MADASQESRLSFLLQQKRHETLFVDVSLSNIEDSKRGIRKIALIGHGQWRSRYRYAIDNADAMAPIPVEVLAVTASTILYPCHKRAVGNSKRYSFSLSAIS